MRSLIILGLLLAGCTEPNTADRASAIELEVTPAAKKRVKVLLAGRWENPPVVLVCPDVSLPATRVHEALRYWEEMGYTFGPTIFMDSIGGCGSTWGAITFRLPTQKELTDAINQQHLATTKRYSLNADPTNIIGADIYFQNEAAAEKPLIVEHEIGHALGWLHARSEGHIMNAAWKKSGAVSTGVTYEDYKEQELSRTSGK